VIAVDIRCLGEPFQSQRGLSGEYERMEELVDENFWWELEIGVVLVPSPFSIKTISFSTFLFSPAFNHQITPNISHSL
jgi:hypothetical protein